MSQEERFVMSTLQESDILWMQVNGQMKEVQPGDVLIEEGQLLDTLYIILVGNLAVSIRDPQPREIARVRGGDVLGEMSFVESSASAATVVAIEYSSILAIPQHKLSEKLRQDEGFASRFYRALAIFLSSRLRNMLTNSHQGVLPNF